MRLMDKNIMNFGHYRLFKSKTDKRILKNTSHLGVAFAVNKNLLNSMTKI